jgi:pimeloyl-ACP methyl ester carboxylesterase
MPNAQPGPRVDTHATDDRGRRIAYAEWGRPDGPPVILMHRSPGSRLLDPDPAVTAAAGVRLVTIDRPGYGATDPVGAPTRSAAATDVVTVADALGIDRVALVGWSGGGQMAVPAAARLGDRLRSLSIVVSPAPHDEVPWVPEPMQPLMDLIRRDPAAGFAAASHAMAAFTDPDALLLDDEGPADAATRARPGVTDALRAMYAEAGRQGGSAFDVVAGSLPDALPLDRVRAPARLWYGDEDRIIGAQHGRWYAERLPRAELTVVAGAGHLLPIDHWAANLKDALAD